MTEHTQQPSGPNPMEAISRITQAARSKPVKNNLYGYFEWNGVPFMGISNPEQLQQLQDFQFMDDDILLVTYPKSGTNFTRDLILDIRSHAGLIPEDPMQKLMHMNGLEIGINLNAAISPRLIVTHLPWRLLPKRARDEKAKIVHVMRNPKDVLCSYYAFLKDGVKLLTPDTILDQFLDQYVTGKVPSGDYFEWLKDWYPHKDEANMLNLHFEDMRKDLKSAVLKLCSHMGITLAEDQVNAIVEKNTFENRKKNQQHEMDKKVLRKGQAGGWKDELNEEQKSKLDDWVTKSMIGLEGLDLKC